MNRREFIQLTSAGLAGSMVIPGSLFGKDSNIDESARFIWYQKTATERNQYGLFRKTFSLKENVKSSVLHLFADTVYRLFINGEFVEFGPARFDPKFPLYDSHDISSYIKPGLNVIAVEVNYFGMKTYKAIPASAGLITWGEIITDRDERISLLSKKGAWKCTPDPAHSHYEPKLSFTLNAMNLYDQQHALENWQHIDFDDSDWQDAVEIADQKIWGELKPRSIPFMSGEIMAIPRIVHLLPLHQNEDWYSFALPAPHFFEDDAEKHSNFIAFTSWIYSPANQTISVGAFWGENWINGVEMKDKIYDPYKSLRMNEQWTLKKGWNHFFGKVGAYYDILDHYYAFPKNSGIIVSADKDKDSPVLFRRTPVLTTAQHERYLKKKPLPYSPQEKIAEIGGWIDVMKDEPAQSPCRETSWDDYGEQVESLTPETLTNHSFRKSFYPQGFTILIDMEYTRLVFPQMEFSGVQNAVIDLTYSEKLAPDNAHLLHVHNFPLGDRLLCSKDTIRWMPNQPRGFRYLKITIRNMQRDVTLRSLSLRSAHYPVTQIGSFKCSDVTLNAVWETGRLSQSVNMEDAYDDTVVRERGMYARDTIIQYCVNLATFGDQKLMQRCLELYGQSPDATGKFRAVYPNTGNYTIADFALDLVEGYRIYYDHSGDLDRIRTDWAAIRKNLAWFDQLSDGRDDLLLNADWYIKQGVAVRYGGFHGDLQVPKGRQDITGIHCGFSCTYLVALKSAAYLASELGFEKEKKELQRRIDVLLKSIPAAFWDEDAQCYADNLKKEAHSIQANLIAVRAGVVSEEQMTGIRALVKNELRHVFVNGYDPSDGALCSPNYAFYLLDGLYKAGLEDIAESLMRQGWGWALAQGLKTTPEYFNITVARRSMCHAWSAAPTYYLSKYVLGVHFPKAPYLNEVEIRVQTATIESAEGVFPHPKGKIKVMWHTENGKRVFDEVSAPEGVRVKVVG